MGSLFIRNLFFTILQPGIVAGVIPYMILDDAIHRTLQNSFGFMQYSGLVFFAAGFILMMICIVSFAILGKGTLSPADPTRKLVTVGLYRYSRNPMYVGVILMLAGESVFFQSVETGIYTILIFILFNFYILFFEEPRLRRDFGEDYARYVKEVRRWI